MKENRSPLMTLEYKRDAYGFSVRPQHLPRYREYANIYKEEEEERSEKKWMDFLKGQAESAQLPVNDLSVEVGDLLLPVDVAVEKTFPLLGKLGNEKDFGGDRLAYSNSLSKIVDEKDKKEVPVPAAHEAKSNKIQIWAEIRPYLVAIEHMTSYRVKKKHPVNDDQVVGNGNYLPMLEDAIRTKGTSEEDSEDDLVQDSPSTDNTNAANNGVLSEFSVPWKEELECLVHGGVPMALRGEVKRNS